MHEFINMASKITKGITICIFHGFTNFDVRVSVRRLAPDYDNNIIFLLTVRLLDENSFCNVRASGFSYGEVKGERSKHI